MKKFIFLALMPNFPFRMPLLLAVLCLFLTGGLLAAGKKASAQAGPAYKGAITLDAATGQVLFEDNADVSNPPASMTKLMTFAVLHEMIQEGSFSLDRECKITEADMRMGGTGVWLDPRETFPAEELVYAMMVQSANDAAHTLARVSAGSVPAFVKRMNEKARELGMTHTTFRTPHGLPADSRRLNEGDLSTPRDFALLCRHLVLHTDVLKYASVKRRAFGPPVRVQAVMMDNHNKLLGKVDGVDGLKTGFTGSAGYCLSATCERNGRRLVVVAMGSPTSKGRDLRVIELLEEGFAHIPTGAPLFAGYKTPKQIIPDSNSPISHAPEASGTPAPASENSEPMIKLNVPGLKAGRK